MLKIAHGKLIDVLFLGITAVLSVMECLKNLVMKNVTAWVAMPF